MKCIIDASVIISVIANEPVKDRLVEITHAADLLAPASVHWEIGNAFSAMYKRGRINLDQIVQALKIYHQIPVRFTEVELDESLNIAAEYNIYAYDAYILRCAVKYKSVLITLDKNLLQVAKAMNLEVIEVEP